VLTIGIAVPTLVSITGITIKGGFVQVAIVCFWIMLWTQSAPSAQVAGVTAAVAGDSEHRVADAQVRPSGTAW